MTTPLVISTTLISFTGWVKNAALGILSQQTNHPDLWWLFFLPRCPQHVFFLILFSCASFSLLRVATCEPFSHERLFLHSSLKKGTPFFVRQTVKELLRSLSRHSTRLVSHTWACVWDVRQEK